MVVVVRSFSQVMTPNIFHTDLWKISGHYKHYRDDMFLFNTNDKEEYALKPMNCPGHCLMFRQGLRSWRDLPIRMADFGVLHRNELKGALGGLTRVRRFQQDDAHIFCRQSQVSWLHRCCLIRALHRFDEEENFYWNYRLNSFEDNSLVGTRAEKHDLFSLAVAPTGRH